MRTVLTGGTGVIGRAAVTALVEAGHDVVVVTRSTEGAAAVRELGAQTLPGNVLDLDSLVAATRDADAVVNLATKVPVGSSVLRPAAWRLHDRLRTTGVANVVEAARRGGVRRVVQESISVLYAGQADGWITEQSALDITPMTEPAAVGESLVQDFTCGSRTGVVLRLGTVLGDDVHTRYWLRAMGGGRATDWVHVIHRDDLGGAVLAALHAPSGVYNVGAEPVRRLDLVEGYVATDHVHPGAFMGAWSRRIVGQRLEPMTRSLRVSGDHFCAQTGWRPLRPAFEAGWFDASPELHDLRR